MIPRTAKLLLVSSLASCALMGRAEAVMDGPGWCAPVRDDETGRPSIQIMNGKRYIEGHDTWADYDNVCFNESGRNAPRRPPA